MPYVYCFQVGSGNLFKIGRTAGDLNRRKASVSTGSPERLALVLEVEVEDACALEQYVHTLLDHKRTENGEFFRVTRGELDEAFRRAQGFYRDSHEDLRIARELESVKPTDELLEPTPEFAEALRKLRELRQKRDIVDYEIAAQEARLKRSIGGRMGIRGIAIWKWQQKLGVDAMRLRAESPEVYEKFKKVSEFRVFRICRGREEERQGGD
jgi:hypothetical protein